MIDINRKTNENDYQQALNNLLLRYSKDGQTVFKKVHNLDDYTGYSGIYVLCIPSARGYYIGKSRNISRRIPQHFTKPRTQFDNSFKLEDIVEMYVLHCGRDLLDVAEVDCIATIPKEFLLNRMAGGRLITFINSSEYDPHHFLLNEERLQGIIDYSEIARKSDSVRIQYETEMAMLRNAASKIKRLKQSSITYELSLQAIQYEGELIEYVPKELRTPELCLKAIGWASDCHKVLQLTPEQARNKEICLYALRYSDKPQKTLLLVPEELLTTEFAEELVKQKKSLLKILPAELQTEQVIRAAASKKRRKKIVEAE